MQLHSKYLYEFGNFRLAVGERRLYRENEPVSLPPKEFDLLALLVSKAGQAMSREDLLKALWPNLVVEEANLNVHVSALRKALSDNGTDKHFIETLPRLGYRFIAPVTTRIAQQTPEFPSALLHQTAQPAAPEPEGETKKISAEISQSVISRALRSIQQSPIHLFAALSLAGALAVSLAAAIYFYAIKPAPWGPASLTDVPLLNAQPLTTYPGRETHPAFSPDGNQLAFVWHKENASNLDIYVRLADGGNTVQITNHPGDEVDPSWSPNGRSLAFYRSTNEGDGIFVVPALGGAERKLTDVWANRFELGPHTWLHWSPKGKWLVYSDKSAMQEPFGLFLLSPETGEKQRLTTPPTSVVGDCSPSFSPDGKQIAFVRLLSVVVGEVFIVNAEGGQPRQLTFSGEGITNLTWMPNGREIIYSSRYGGRNTLFRVAADGSRAKPQPIGVHDGQFPAFAPQSDHLAWTRSTDNTDILRVTLPPEVSKEVSGTKALPRLANWIASTASETSPRYAPNGKRIAFVSNRSGSDEIWVCDSEGENATKLTSFRGPLAGSPSWSPDSKQIAFDCRPDGNPDIFVINSEGGPARRLTTEATEDIVPSWSRDGRWIYFTSQRSGRLQIWKIPPTGGAAVQVTQHGGFEPVESPDGQWLYYTQDRGSSAIWRVPAAGGVESPVFDFHQKNFSRMWTITDAGILFAVPLNQTRAALRLFNLATRTEQLLAEFDCILRNSVSGLSRAPDGTTFLFPVITQRGSDLMMVENFR